MEENHPPGILKPNSTTRETELTRSLQAERPT